MKKGDIGIYLFVQSSHLFNTYYVPSTMLGTRENTELNSALKYVIFERNKHFKNNQSKSINY